MDRAHSCAFGQREGLLEVPGCPACQVRRRPHLPIHGHRGAEEPRVTAHRPPVRQAVLPSWPPESHEGAPRARQHCHVPLHGGPDFFCAWQPLNRRISGCRKGGVTRREPINWCGPKSGPKWVQVAVQNGSKGHCIKGKSATCTSAYVHGSKYAHPSRSY